MINISQEDYEIVRQPIQKRYIKLNILDFNYQIVDEISGVVTDCSFSEDANSDLRRSCNINIVISQKDKNKFAIQPGGEIWLDKFINPFIGIENIKTGEIQYYSQGIYLINRPTWDYDAQTNTLKFDGIDLMSKMTGERNGALEGIPTIIHAGENVRNVMIATLELAGFNKYIISECLNDDGSIQNVPNDITINQGGTVYEIISSLRDILPNYQVFFDEVGVFHYEKIPTGKNEAILFDDDLLNDILISESINTKFDEVKNYIEVWGKSHDVQNYSTDTKVVNGNVYLTMADLPSEIASGTLFGFTLPTVANKSPYIEIFINGKSYGALEVDTYRYVTQLNANEYYVATVQTGSRNSVLFLGHQQAQGTAFDNNPMSPFYVDGSVGRIRHVCTGGDYDVIPSDYLAEQRAKFELYQRCKLHDDISLYTIPIPWLDVHQLISHKSDDGTGETRQYLIQSISSSFGESNTMTIVANQFYPYYDG